MEEAQFTDVASRPEIRSTSTGGAETRGHLYQVKGTHLAFFIYFRCCSRPVGLAALSDSFCLLPV